MKVFQETSVFELSSNLQKVLQAFRYKRHFNVAEYVHLKAILLNNYMKKCNLDTCIVAVSGGVDSSVVLALVDYASKYDNSHIKNIIPVALPCMYNSGVTNQKSATDKANILCQSLSLGLKIVDIGDTVQTVINDFPEATDWAKGQLVSYVRTPYLYYMTSLFSDIGHRAIIMGTNNRDEISYTGFLAKAGDGLTDVNIVSDLHKSEVYTVAKYLRVPNVIINAEPNGDMYDNRKDVEVFGASYDFIELYTSYLNMDSSARLEILTMIEFINAREEFNKFAANVEKLHSYNRHKYFVGSPCVHLDLYESGTKDGFRLNFGDLYNTEIVKRGNFIKSCFVSPFESNTLNDYFLKKIPHKTYFDIDETSTDMEYRDIFNSDDINVLIDAYQKAIKKESNINGYVENGTGGSLRCSTYSVELATYLWNVLRGNFLSLVYATHPDTDFSKGEIWKAVGVNPLMRYIGYENNAKLVPHYDYAYNDSEGRRSLYSVVIYLTTNDKGATRFLKDEHANNWNKDLNDKDIDFNSKIEFSCKAEAGKAFIFPHHILHDSEPTDEFKLIIRTDIMFEKVRFSGE